MDLAASSLNVWMFDLGSLTWSVCCRQILLVSEIIVMIGILLSFNVTSSYSVPQYVISALITFVAAEVLEGT